MIKVIKLKPGCCLLATPKLDQNPMFNRSVVLLTEHTSNGYHGVLLTIPSPITIAHLNWNIPMDLTAKHQPILMGGSYQPKRTFMLQSPAGPLVTPKYHTLLHHWSNGHAWPLFLGHCQWPYHTLKRNIVQGKWEVLALKSLQTIFDRPIANRYAWAQNRLDRDFIRYHTRSLGHG